MPRKPRESRKKLEPVYQLIYELAELFGYRCEVCDKKMTKPMSGFTIHHLVYRKGEKTHKNFLSRLKYYLYLKPIIKKFHKKGQLHQNFAFLCNPCHHSLDGPRGLNRRKKINVMRLFLMYFRTNT